MKEINIKIKLYNYEELNPESKERAFQEHYDFLATIPYDYETEDQEGNIIQKKEYIENWEEEQIKEYVEESININDYMFFESGEMAPIIQYLGNHPKAGTKELKIYNTIYII